jgi:hypothetical protein
VKGGKAPPTEPIRNELKVNETIRHELASLFFKVPDLCIKHNTVLITSRRQGLRYSLLLENVTFSRAVLKVCY